LQLARSILIFTRGRAVHIGALLILIHVSAASLRGATTIDSVPISLRPVRVLVADGLANASIRSSSSLTIRDANYSGLAKVSPLSSEVSLRALDGSLIVGEQTWPQNDVYVESKDGVVVLMTDSGQDTPIETTFAGRLRVISDGQLQIINEVDLEDYVSSVVGSEIWPNFEVEAFRVQAIVTRTYVLYHMLRRSNTLYDVAATQGSQVYRGIRTDAVGRTAAEAAEYTKGLVCAWREEGHDRIFCTYYSAACGGMSQSAAPLGAESDIPPLAGGVRCDYCRIAPGQTYRWGPVRLALREVYGRLCERYPELVELRSIRSIEPAELTRFGRPLSLKITGSAGEPHEILAERFRLAVGPNALKSTDCNMRVEGNEIVFEDGKGYGHGLGLCQWGMQGQALEGRRAAEILRYYFPGSRLVRVY
jgi:stage II sporulation protein D